MKSALDTALDTVIDQIIAPGGQLEVGGAQACAGRRLPVFAGGPANMRDYLALFFAANGDPRIPGLSRRAPDLRAKSMSESIRVAACLQHRHGIAKGDRVAIAMRNYPEWVTSFVAILHLGAIAVPMNAWWQADELAYGLHDSGTRLVIADEERARRLARQADRCQPETADRADQPRGGRRAGLRTARGQSSPTAPRHRGSCPTIDRRRTTPRSCTRPARRAARRARSAPTGLPSAAR